MLKLRWILSGALLSGLAWWGLSETRAESGMGIAAGPVLSVVSASDLGSPQILAVVDTAQRKIAVYTTDKQGRVVFAALRPYVYDLSVSEELSLAPNTAYPSWQQMQQASAAAYRGDLEDFRKKNPGATLEDCLKNHLKDSTGQTQLSAAGSAIPGTASLIQVLDLANQRLLVYGFNFRTGLELVSTRDIAADFKLPERVGRPDYLSVQDVRKAAKR